MFRILLALTAAAITTLQAQPEISSRVTVLTHATVIDVTGAPAQSGMTLLIDGKRITALGKDESMPIPTNAHLIDANGKFVIPGLWDMHVHLSWTKMSAIPALVANGVTGVRDLGGLLRELDEWRVKIDSGVMDIRNTQKIRAVILGGRYLDRLTLNGLLRDAERAAQRE